MEKERFVLQHSEIEPGKLVCTDTENGIVCVFEPKRFNDTQKVSFYENMTPDALKLARYMREMGEWLYENHKEKVF